MANRTDKEAGTVHGTDPQVRKKRRERRDTPRRFSIRFLCCLSLSLSLRSNTRPPLFLSRPATEQKQTNRTSSRRSCAPASMTQSTGSSTASASPRRACSTRRPASLGRRRRRLGRSGGSGPPFALHLPGFEAAAAATRQGDRAGVYQQGREQVRAAAGRVLPEADR